MKNSEKKSHADALQQIVFGELLSKKLSKSERTKFQIMQAAIECYTRYGMENTTYNKISQVAKVSRPLVIHYFPKPDELFGFVSKFIRAHLQKFVVDKMPPESSTKKQLEAYVQAVHAWVVAFPDYSSVFVYFYFECSRNLKLRKIHSEMVEVGATRIVAMINPKLKDRYERARLIQFLIGGFALAVTTEEQTHQKSTLPDRVVISCLELAGWN